MKETAKTPMQFNLRVETAKLVDALRTGSSGDILTDEQLHTVCGKGVKPGEPGYPYLQSAIRRTLSEYGLVWKRIVGAGCIKCLESREILSLGKNARRHIHRCSKRAMRQLGEVVPAELDNEERIAFHTLCAQHGTLLAMSSTSTAKKLAARNISEPVDISKLLEAMKTGTIPADES